MAGAWRAGGGPGEDGGELVIRFAAPDRATLERIAAGPLPFAALPAGPLESFRDVYFDSAGLELRRKGATVGVRHAADGTLTLAVELRPDDGAPATLAAASARAATAEALFAAPGEAGQLLRSLLDPARLVPWLEVETLRRSRPAGTAGDAADPPGEVLEVACEERTVRDPAGAAQLFEVELRLGADTPAARAAAGALERAFALTLLAGDPLRRWVASLEAAELDTLRAGVRASRRVVVIAYAAGRVMVHGDARGVLRLPSDTGSGIRDARRVLRQQLGAEGRVRLLGTGPGSARHPATEVWLAEDALPAQAAPGTLAVAADELLAAVGTPALSDAATLAGLHVLARSGLPVHPLRPDWELDADPGAELAEARARRPPPPRASDPLGPGTLLNPELSVLAFNRRVLELASDPEVPLLDRLRFLSIFGGNLDEFFRVRVAGFKRQVAQGSEQPGLDGVAPRAQLDAVGSRARRLADASYRLLFDVLLPELRAAGVEVVPRSRLTRAERAWLQLFYRAELHPLLTPLAAGPGHPFPHIRNQRPALAALLREPLTGAERLGIVELPDGVPRFVALPGGERLVALETVMVDNLEQLYPGREVNAASTFRVTRSAELLLDPAAEGDLLHAVEEEVRRRRTQPVVRVEVEDSMTPRLRTLLLRELRHETPTQAWPLGEEDVYGVEGLMDLRGVRELASLPLAGLAWPAEPALDPFDRRLPIAELLREGDLLLEFPRDSFEATVERFVLEAAEDPSVEAIKLALYRTNRRSRIVEALRRASAAGKQVVALVEITARFDEERNIEWARYLRSAGIHVVYGLPGLKVHAKVALAVRRDERGVHRQAYVGTGNLNATTAAAYTDLGLLTADPAITAEVAELFNRLTGAAGEPGWNTLLVAPQSMRSRFLQLIERETAHAQAGRPAALVAKMNGLADREIIAALYRASEAGVRIDLVVRSLCALRPGVAGLSQNIRVTSILGRYLEHARIFRFANDGKPEYFIGSADWRTRNLSRRVEVACPIRAPAHRARLDAILQEQLEHPRAWELGSDGTYYRRPTPAPRDPAPPEPDPARPSILTA